MYSAHTLTYTWAPCLSEVYNNDKKSARNIKAYASRTKRYVSPRDVVYALQIIYANCKKNS